MSTVGVTGGSRWVLVTLLAVAACAGPDQPDASRAPASDTGAEHMQAQVHDAGTLREIMVGLGTEMRRLGDALWLDDFDGVAGAAGAVAEHAHVSPAEMQRIQSVLGADFAAFVQGDTRVHDAAVEVRAAAAGRDTAAVLNGLAELQRGCVSCHAMFRTRLLTPVSPD